MSLSQTGTFVETIIDLVDGATRANIIGFSSNNKLVLNGAAGADGGSGIPWGGLVGQLIQRRVCYDTTEAATPCILPSSSLLDNLNHIRWHHQPATWFEMSPTDPRSMRVNVASGIWYKDEADTVDFTGGNSPIITSPTIDPRIDVVYLTVSGVVAVSEGVESASPIYTIPSGTILPIGAVYVTPSTSGIGWPCDTLLYSGSLYSGYIYKDLRPFVTYPGGGGGTLIHNDLTGLQGCQANQYYHLTLVQHTAVGLMVTAGLDALTAAEVDQLENIGATIIGVAQWGHVGAMNQDVATTDSPTFANVWLPDGGAVGNSAADMRIVFHAADYIEILTDGLNIYEIDNDPSGATPMTATAANIAIIGGDNAVGDDAGLWLRNEFTNVDWSIYVDESDSDHLKIARDNTEVAEFTTTGNFTMFSGNDIDPEDATGQDLGSSAHRWDLYADDINMDNGGVIHCTNLGGPIITFDSISDYLEITECRVSIGHGTPLVALDINTPEYTHNGILLGSGGPPGVLGMIKFTGIDFFGYTTSGWLSLTDALGGGGGASLWTDHGAFIEPTNPRDVRIGSTQDLYPSDATGQDLGRANNRWDVFARTINARGNITLDDAAGDSPYVRFVGGSNDDTASIYLDDVAVAGRSDLRVLLADNAGESHLYVCDSGGVVMFSVDSDGTALARAWQVTGQVEMSDATWIGNSAATARLHFDSSGAADYAYFMGCNVGIGTTTPGAQLEIAKDQNPAELWMSTYKTAATAGFIRSNRARGTQAVPLVVANNDLIGGWIGRGYSAAAGGFLNAAQINFYVDGVPDSGADPTDMPGRITFWTTPDGTSTTVERVRIDNAGNVGIGNTTPDYLLDVGSDAFAAVAVVKINSAANQQAGFLVCAAGATSWYMYRPANSVDLRFLDGVADRVTFQNGGGVGLGTTAIPHGAVGNALLALEGTDGHADGPHVQFTTATNDYPIITILPWQHDVCGILFDAYYEGGWKSSDAGSSFGIYKLSDKLHLWYDTAAAGAAVTWNEGIVLTAAGYVGIAEANPQRLLHVDGRVRIDDVGTEPGVTAGGGFTHYYGSLYYFCGRPDQWLRIDIEGATYHIPCYS